MEKKEIIEVLKNGKEYLLRINNPKSIRHGTHAIGIYYEEHKCFNLNPPIHFDDIDKCIDIEAIADELSEEKCYNYAILDVNKLYQFTIQDIDTNEIIIISENTERKAFRKASRYFGEQELRDRDLQIIDKCSNKKK